MYIGISFSNFLNFFNFTTIIISGKYVFVLINIFIHNRNTAKKLKESEEKERAEKEELKMLLEAYQDNVC